jgi:hypothetical protein
MEKKKNVFCFLPYLYKIIFIYGTSSSLLYNLRNIFLIKLCLSTPSFNTQTSLLSIIAYYIFQDYWRIFFLFLFPPYHKNFSSNTIYFLLLFVGILNMHNQYKEEEGSLRQWIILTILTMNFKNNSAYKDSVEIT